MGSALVNYYRKKDEKDDHIPKVQTLQSCHSFDLISTQLDLGVPFILEPQDETPFMRFGSVYPGQVVPALYNHLVRAPLFRHKPYPTDFLVIRFILSCAYPVSTPTIFHRSTIKGEPKYYIREIKNLFVIGQTYPVTEVPGPHSRKITNTIKYRLQIIAIKLLKKSTGGE